MIILFPKKLIKFVYSWLFTIIVSRLADFQTELPTIYLHFSQFSALTKVKNLQQGTEACTKPMFLLSCVVVSNYLGNAGLLTIFTFE